MDLFYILVNLFIHSSGPIVHSSGPLLDHSFSGWGGSSEPREHPWQNYSSRPHMLFQLYVCTHTPTSEGVLLFLPHKHVMASSLEKCVNNPLKLSTLIVG